VSDLLLSFLVYAIPANLIGGSIFLVARKRGQMEGLEYFAIYVPYLVFAVMFASHLDHPAALGSNATFHAFAVILQPIGSGVLGGLALMPRLFRFPDERRKRLLITLTCAGVMAGVYMLSRFMLFAILGASYS